MEETQLILGDSGEILLALEIWCTDSGWWSRFWGLLWCVYMWIVNVNKSDTNIPCGSQITCQCASGFNRLPYCYYCSKASSQITVNLNCTELKHHRLPLIGTSSYDIKDGEAWRSSCSGEWTRRGCERIHEGHRFYQFVQKYEGNFRWVIWLLMINWSP